ncbi:MAG TPA: hypothetical protein VMP68_08325 [Candidatus Eisenbacteria bacterium]|nr:hypothetical protein [Candidatus Eisenbacteria bacterium]
MPLEDELCFVQFIHPGAEHEPGGNMSMEWNRHAHKRKFVEIAGRCQRQEVVFDGPLRFWAEWEPESRATPISQPLEHEPHFVQRLFYVRPNSYTGRQNTDPFVFGGFFYTGCQQNTCRGATQLRFLKRGSVILFGSWVDDQFVLDTVFVVDKWEDHNAHDFLRLKDLVPQTFWDVALQPWYQHNDCAGSRVNPAPSSCRLYWGATSGKPVDGMFSFFPCMLADQAPRGFARPAIAIPGVITNQLRQGKRLNREGLTPRKVTEYWNRVRKQVESKGLWLGVHAEIPKRHKDRI